MGLKCPMPVWPRDFLWKFIVRNKFYRLLQAKMELRKRIELDFLKDPDRVSLSFSRGEKAIDLALLC